MHISCMEVLNKHLGILPTIKNSPLAVASTEMGNVPFTEATYASIILSHLPVVWRNQYDLTHNTVPESPCTMLQDRENIKKLLRSSLLRSTTRKPKPTRLRLQQPPRWLSACSRSARVGDGPIEEPPKRAVLPSIACGARRQMGPIPPTIPSSVVGSRKDGMPKDKPVKPFNSARKPWKKTGSGDSSQMAYLTEKVAKLEKKLKKTKKHGKKGARDSLDSDSNSD
jgi:hypothetical protein